MKYHLAQINIAKLVAPIDSPIIADFVADLDRINSLAEQSTGFIWRLKDENNNATAINPFDDPLIIVNMSVWENIDLLKQYVYRSAHTEVFLKRAKWFEKAQEANVALWWIPVGTVPTAQEGKDRLLHLRTFGDTTYSYTFKNLFPAPSIDLL